MSHPRASDPLTAERLRELLHYDPETGKWTRAITWYGIPAGTPVGWVGKRGRWAATVEGRLYYLSRLAWLYMKGEWPPADVDHKDTDKLNERWDNLRSATRAENIANTAKRSNNTSGYKGICLNRRVNCWIAYIDKDRKRRYLGYFDTPEEAHAAYVRAALELHGEFARLE